MISLKLLAIFDVIIVDNVIKSIDKPNNTCFVVTILMAQYNILIVAVVVVIDSRKHKDSCIRLCVYLVWRFGWNMPCDFHPSCERFVAYSHS